MSQILSTNTFTTAKWIVSATASDGTHTTIAGALTSASSGDTIFIRPGTYTEANITLKVGVNLVAYTADAFTPNVTIIGNCTLTTAGTVSISGIRLQTNSAALLTVSGSAASIVNLFDCYLNCTNNTGITLSSSDANSQVFLNSCNGDLGTTGIAIFAHSGAGFLRMQNCFITNSGGSSTASTISGAGNGVLQSCRILNPVTTSSTSGLFIIGTSINTSPQNVTSLTVNGTGNNNFSNSVFVSGSASVISVGAGATLNIFLCQVNSSNTNAITGAGIIVFSCLSFANSSSTINTTTQSPTYTNLGKFRSTGQPAFLAYVDTTITNVTGDATIYTVIFDTEVFDQGGDFNLGTSTFTAPITGKYLLEFTCFVTGGTTITNANIKIITSNRTYNNKMLNNGAASTDCTKTIVVIADMDAADTATFVVQTIDGGGKIDDVSGTTTGDLRTYCSGQLIC